MEVRGGGWDRRKIGDSELSWAAAWASGGWLLGCRGSGPRRAAGAWWALDKRNLAAATAEGWLHYAPARAVRGGCEVRGRKDTATATGAGVAGSSCAAPKGIHGSDVPTCMEIKVASRVFRKCGSVMMEERRGAGIPKSICCDKLDVGDLGGLDFPLVSRGMGSETWGWGI